MLTIIGATGNVGAATVAALRDAGAQVRVVLRDPGRRERFETVGCQVVIADLQRPERLVDAIAGSDAVQIVVPLRPSANDPVADMQLSVDSVMAALSAARVPRVLAISDYGAHVRGDIGMPTIFHHLEGRIMELDGRKTLLRSAEHMHNLARAVPAAVASGVFPTFQDPPEQAQPMIAAHDLGRISADLLIRDQAVDIAIVHAEGPSRYSANDVARILGELSGRTVTAQSAPRAAWEGILERTMPSSLARLLARTNEAKNAGGLVDVEKGVGEVVTGTTGLIDVLRRSMAR